MINKYGKESDPIFLLDEKIDVDVNNCNESSSNNAYTLLAAEEKNRFNPNYVIKKIRQQQYNLEVLDFRSPMFDSKLALEETTSSLSNFSNISYYKQETLDNLSKCRYMLSKFHCDYATEVLKRRASLKKEIGSTTRKPDAMKKQIQNVVRLHPPVTVFNKIVDAWSGPLRMLKECLINRRRIGVMIRRVNSVRGTCVGVLKAVDRHLNICLFDVTETYIPLSVQKTRHKKERKKNIKTPTTFSVFGTIQSPLTDPSLVKRHLHQILIRGDNVVMVYRA